jgi:hypothetical protein
MAQAAARSSLASSADKDCWLDPHQARWNRVRRCSPLAEQRDID